MGSHPHFFLSVASGLRLNSRVKAKLKFGRSLAASAALHSSSVLNRERECGHRRCRHETPTHARVCLAARTFGFSWYQKQQRYLILRETHILPPKITHCHFGTVTCTRPVPIELTIYLSWEGGVSTYNQMGNVLARRVRRSMALPRPGYGLGLDRSPLEKVGQKRPQAGVEFESH